VNRRWMITFAFGPGPRIRILIRAAPIAAISRARTCWTSLLFIQRRSLKLGQLLVLVLLIPVLDMLFRFVVAERMGTIILSALVSATTGWHWMNGARWENPETIPVPVAGH